ncbi:MAG TPA: SDR family NAD(P)-dependent oxidoreductase, partial [Bryobacteraceae bacterium]|nr:SDR family NAD(P)-dependent oxidoreductase [Bryobacteraceae bacterium]
MALFHNLTPSRRAAVLHSTFIVRQSYDTVEINNPMSNEKLSGKIAVITGGARGIGFAIASHLVEEGVSVAVVALRQESAEAAVTKLSAKGKALGIAGDVSNE